jgi:hypothetical protein
MATPLIILTVIFALFSLGFLAVAIRALKRKKVIGTATNTLVALLMFTLSTLFAVLTVSTQGYRAFTREDLVASVTTKRLADQRFEAQVRFPDGRDTTFLLDGDEFYMDAHILKWKPIANILGFHTDYELDRIAGRYFDVWQEQTKPRTVFALSSSKPIDLFDLRRRHPILRWLVDAEYGSGTFIATDAETEFDVLVSTSGLMIRKKDQPSSQP